MDGAKGNGIEAGIGSGDDELRYGAPVTTASGAGVRSGLSVAVVTNGFRSSGSAIGSVDGFALALGATDGDERGAMDGDVRGATDGGAGGAIEGARGAIGAWPAARLPDGRPAACGAIDPGLAADAEASADASLMRRVPGATLSAASS